jgi:CheY-like chemotaxis protein
VALAQAQLSPPDLFLCDLFMAEVDGAEAIRGFRTAFPNVPIVAMSGAIPDNNRDMLPEVESLGADRVLAKPFSLAHLSKLLEELLGRLKAAG